MWRDPLEIQWSTKDSSDFVIIADGQEFRVHKKVLSYQSRVMSEILQNENNTELIIIQTTATTVSHFLKLFYTGNWPDDANAIDLYTLAAKFDCAEFKAQCIGHLPTEIKKFQAFKFFSFAHRYDLQDFKQKAFDKIKILFPGRVLHERFMDDPDGLKELIVAARDRKQEIAKAEQKFNDIWEKKQKPE